MKEITEATKYDKKSRFRGIFIGFFLGIAVIIPGISGAGVAIAFGVYEQILDAISKIFTKFKWAILYLLPFVIGGIVGYILGFFSIKFLLAILPFATICIFAGLMTGSVPSMFKGLDTRNASPHLWMIMILGIITIVTLSLTPLSFKGSFDFLFSGDFNWKSYLFIFIVGILLSLTQIVPGLSATTMLLSFGIFRRLINSLSISMWEENPFWFLVYIFLVLGNIVGLILFTSLINKAFKKGHETTMYLVIGFTIGSIISIFLNTETVDIFTSWANQSYASGVLNMVYDLPVGIILFFASIVGSYYFFKKYSS
jgi:putative membrane protein